MLFLIVKNINTFFMQKNINTIFFMASCAVSGSILNIDKLSRNGNKFVDIMNINFFCPNVFESFMNIINFYSYFILGA